MNAEFVVVLSTFSSKKEAEKIIKVLLDKKLIACANLVFDVSSFFLWEGKTKTETEVFAVMKTRTDLFEKVNKTIQEEHSYSVPEVIALPVVLGSESYLNWVKEVTKL